MSKKQQKNVDTAGFWGHVWAQQGPLLPAPRALSGVSVMVRPRAIEPYVRQKVNFPATLIARFGNIHWDPVLRKPQYGAISHVLTQLLTSYVNQMEQPGAEPFKIPSSAETISSAELDAL